MRVANFELTVTHDHGRATLTVALSGAAAPALAQVVTAEDLERVANWLDGEAARLKPPPPVEHTEGGKT